MRPARPELSVVVATHERAERLEDLLAALRRQTLAPSRFEVVVVDDASYDRTPAVLAAEGARGELDLKALRRSVNGGSGLAREDGWRAARAPHVAFTDDDCVPDPDWAEAMLRACVAQPDAMVQGRTDPIAGELEAMPRWRRPFTRTVRVVEPDAAFQTCNVAYPRELLERIGGFDTDSYPRYPGEDADLAWRAIAAGGNPVFAPEVRVQHAVNDLGPLGKLAHAAAWDMKIYARNPELRRAHFAYGPFWKLTHLWLLWALVAILAPRRLDPLRGLMARRYAQSLWARGKLEGGGPLAAPYYVLFDLTEMATVIRDGVRYRTPML